MPPLARRYGVLLSLLAFAGCTPDDGSAPADTEDSWAPDQIVGANAVGRRMAVEGFVYVPVGATQDAIVTAVKAQMPPLLMPAMARPAAS